MAILHKATLIPSKLELIAQYLPQQPWFVPENPSPGTGQTALLGAYRFDDPDGEVGLETHLVEHAGTVYQIPLSYRGAPLAEEVRPDAESWLIGTMDHSVLGKRWVYDACADPVYVTALATAILTGQHGAEQFVEVDGKLEPRPSTARVIGSGAPDGVLPPLAPQAPVTADGETTIDAGAVQLAVTRLVDPGRVSEKPALHGTWEGQQTPVVLATVSTR